MKIKGLNEYLMDDADLMKEITYQEYLEKKAAPGNSDYPIEDAYAEYCKVLEQEMNNPEFPSLSGSTLQICLNKRF